MKPKVYLIGVGMGNLHTMTVEAVRAVADCAVLIGAPRLLEPYEGRVCAPMTSASEICAYIETLETGPVGVLLSGDVGFYSGAKNLWAPLAHYEVETISGISSLVYLCGKRCTPWQDVQVVSAHGRSHNAAGKIQSAEKTFVLTGGRTHPEDICKQLCARGLSHVRVSVGENLSYPQERIVVGTAGELAEVHFAELSVLLVENDGPMVQAYPGIPDANFQRGDVPMTKEEVRVVSLSKLRLSPEHVLWDVGAGTGSVSVEGALAVPAGRVYAVEKKEAALKLLAENKRQFGVTNLEIIAGSAPEALEALPAPDRVFLGGTSGNLVEILTLALGKNPTLRVVVNAVTLETLSEAVTCFETLGLVEVDIAQIAVTKAKALGSYHMMQAQNPVWVISGEGSA